MSLKKRLSNPNFDSLTDSEINLTLREKFYLAELIFQTRNRKPSEEVLNDKDNWAKLINELDRDGLRDRLLTDWTEYEQSKDFIKDFTRCPNK